MEAVCWYNITPNEDVSSSTAPASTIYTYQIRIKGVDTTLTSVYEKIHWPYNVGDPTWVKPPRCPIPHHIKDLCLTFGATSATNIFSDSSNESSDSKMLLQFNPCLPNGPSDGLPMSPSTSDNSSEETCAILPWRNTRQRRPGRVNDCPHPLWWNTWQKKGQPSVAIFCEEIVGRGCAVKKKPNYPQRSWKCIPADSIVSMLRIKPRESHSVLYKRKCFME